MWVPGTFLQRSQEGWNFGHWDRNGPSHCVRNATKMDRPVWLHFSCRKVVCESLGPSWDLPATVPGRLEFRTLGPKWTITIRSQDGPATEMRPKWMVHFGRSIGPFWSHGLLGCQWPFSISTGTCIVFSCFVCVFFSCRLHKFEWQLRFQIFKR
jgi:hypothetical protein